MPCCSLLDRVYVSYTTWKQWHLWWNIEVKTREDLKNRHTDVYNLLLLCTKAVIGGKNKTNKKTDSYSPITNQHLFPDKIWTFMLRQLGRVSLLINTRPAINYNEVFRKLLPQTRDFSNSWLQNQEASVTQQVTCSDAVFGQRYHWQHCISQKCIK